MSKRNDITFQRDHDFTLLEDPYTETTVEIDNKMVNLITSLWSIDINTSMCCEDIEGKCWIEFPSVTSFSKFISICLINSKLTFEIRRSGREILCYHVNFDVKNLKKLEKIFRDYRK